VLTDPDEFEGDGGEAARGVRRGDDVAADTTVSESPVHVEALEKPDDADSSEDDRDDGVFSDNTVSE
jgi:hypothetical protein